MLGQMSIWKEDALVDGDGRYAGWSSSNCLSFTVNHSVLTALVALVGATVSFPWVFPQTRSAGLIIDLAHKVFPQNIRRWTSRESVQIFEASIPPPLVIPSIDHNAKLLLRKSLLGVCYCRDAVPSH